jgi:hypothetical protein
MNMQEFNTAYPDAESFYQAFLDSDFGDKRWDTAYELFPDYNDGGSDTEEAIDYIMEGMQMWCKQQITGQQTIFWFMKMEDELASSVLGGLT